MRHTEQPTPKLLRSRFVPAAILAASVSFASFGLQGPMAVADDTSPPPSTSGEDRDVGPLDPEALAAYARSAGISLEAAKKLMTQEQRLLSSAASHGLIMDGSKADVWVEASDDQLVLHIRTTDAKSLEAASGSAKTAGMALVVEPAPALAAARAAQVNQLASQIPGLMGYYVDAKTGQLILDVVPSEAKGISTAETVAIAEKAIGLPTMVNSLDGPMGDAATVHGGAALGNCTAAFTGTFTSGSSGFQGFLTAAHCSQKVSYYYTTTANGTSKAATYKAQTYNSNADIAFHALASGDVKSTQFFGASSSSPTTRGSIGTAPQGTTACRRGKASGYSYGTVQSLYYAPTWANACPTGPCNTTFVRMLGTVPQGDSGGPVWAGTNMLVGITKGGNNTATPGGIVAYSKLTYMPTGVTL